MNVIDKSLHNVDTPGPSSTGDSDTSVDKMFMIGCVKKIPERKNHASNYPCPYCIALKKFLEKEKALLRTLDMLSTDLGKKDGKKDVHSAL